MRPPRLGPQLVIESIVGGQDSTCKVLYSPSKDEKLAAQTGLVLDILIHCRWSRFDMQSVVFAWQG